MSSRSNGSARAFAACALGALFTAPGHAAAYSDPDFYAFTAPGGGAGGRYFTGSPLDSYTCKVCHESKPEPAMRIYGLPTGGYQTGQSYEITVDWSDKLKHFAAAVEITDMQGRRAGTVRLPEGDEALEQELCESADELGAVLIRVPPEDHAGDPTFCGDATERTPPACRQVVFVRDCQSLRLRFLWTAPVWTTPLWFAGSGVAPDGDSTTAGDAVVDFSRRMVAASKSDDDPGLTTQASCSAASAAQRRAGNESGVLFTIVLAAISFCIRVRARRKTLR